MKKEMIRASIYIEKQVWQGMRESAHDRWVSIGKYLTEAHAELSKVNKVNKVHKPQVPEKVIETQKPEKPESIFSTGERPNKPDKSTGNKPVQPDKFESHKSNLDTKEKVKKIINDIPLVQPASNFFNPQTKK